MSEPILGTFRLRPVNEDDELLVVEASGLLPFEEAVARLITDYEAHPHTARDIAIKASKGGEGTLVAPLTHRAVRVIYSA